LKKNVSEVTYQVKYFQYLLKKKPSVIPLAEGYEEKTGDVLLSRPALADSTIGAVGLNFRVRKGIGCFPYAIVTGKVKDKENRSCAQGSRSINLKRLFKPHG
jgi:hypothetical protein